MGSSYNRRKEDCVPEETRVAISLKPVVDLGNWPEEYQASSPLHIVS